MCKQLLAILRFEHFLHKYNSEEFRQYFTTYLNSFVDLVRQPEQIAITLSANLEFDSTMYNSVNCLGVINGSP